MLFKQFDTDGTPGTSQILAYYEGNAAFFVECAEKARLWLTGISPARQILRAPELAGVRAVAIRKSSYPAVKVDEFLALAVMGGVNEDDKSPAARLFQFLTARTKTVSVSRRVMLTLDALNQTVTGKTRRLDMVRRIKRDQIQAPAEIAVDVPTGAEVTA
jgi:hypothetical protein